MKDRFLISGIVLLLHFMAGTALAQIPVPPGTLPSPNAASLGLYGDYPVSHFTGLPQIGIPLYEINEGGLKVPISLSYHASGFRPDQHPGWVGMGWSLQAGGVISRSVNDLPDEFDNPNFNQGAGAGYYYNHAVLNRTDWASTSYMQTIARGDLSFKDTEPDEFSFVLPDGTSGKFYRSHTRTWEVRCDRPVQIQPTSTSMLAVPFTPPAGSPYVTYGYFKSYPGFVITDENGIKYTFGAKMFDTSTDAIEYSTVFFNQNESHWTATSWYLVNITYPFTAQDDEINFSYARDSFIAQMYISVNNNLGTKTVSSGGILNPSCSSWSYSSIAASYWGNLVSPVYMTEISAGTQKVKFTRSNTTELRYPQATFDWQYSMWSMYGMYSSFLPFLEDNGYSNTYPTNLNKLQWKKLDQVRIEENGVLQKAYNLAYSNSTSQRLTLLSVTEQGKSGGTLKPYTFTYNTSKSLPGYLANMTDHWGFYNGTYADISNQSTYYINYSSYKQPKSDFLQAGTLNKITYPTGGVTDFEFEPHEYTGMVRAQREQGISRGYEASLAGGQRIRKITSYDPLLPEQKTEKKYTYDGYPWGDGLGSLWSTGILDGEVRYYFNDYRVKAFNNSSLTYSQSLFSSQSVLPANYNSNGSHIGYSTVTENLNDGSYTMYDYSNYDNGNHLDIAPNNSLQPLRMAYEPYTSKEMNRGKLLRERTYSASNVLLRDRELTYIQTGQNAGTEVRAMKARYFNVCPSTASSAEEGTAYRFLTHSFLPASEKITEYDMAGANPVTTTRTMTYDNLFGKLLRQELFTDSKGIQHRTGYRYPFDVSTSPTIYADPLFDAVLSMRSYNMMGIPLEVVNSTILSSGEIVTGAEVTIYKGHAVDLWVTPFQKLALNTNISLPKSSYVPFTATVSGQFEYEQNNLDPRLKAVEEYTYVGAKPRPVGISESDGPWRSYIWGYGDRHVTAIVHNRDATASYTGFESASKGGWSYAGATVADATAPTGLRAYNLSGGAVSRSGMTASKTYLLSYWAKSAAAAGISGGTATAVRTHNGWTLYRRQLTGVTGLTLSGTVLVDDLRLHPLDAAMTTYTYNELGAVTSETDGRGNIIRYEYDEFNRLRIVRDQQGRIIQDHTYNLR